MGYDQNRSVDLISHFFKYFDQAVKTPEVDPCLRLIKNRKLRSPCSDHCDLDPFQLTAGKTSVDLTVNVFSCTQTYLR